MTHMLRINEYDQTIVSDVPVSEYQPPNTFIRDLIAAALADEDGEAVHEDAEGCPVTAVVWHEV